MKNNSCIITCTFV